MKGIPGIVVAIVLGLILLNVLAALLKRSPAPEDDPVMKQLDDLFLKTADTGRREREELRLRSSTDRDASLQLEQILQRDLNAHRMMKLRLIPTMPWEQRAAALEKIERRERKDQAELESLRATRRNL